MKQHVVCSPDATPRLGKREREELQVARVLRRSCQLLRFSVVASYWKLSGIEGEKNSKC